MYFILKKSSATYFVHSGPYPTFSLAFTALHNAIQKSGLTLVRSVNVETRNDD